MAHVGGPLCGFLRHFAACYTVIQPVIHPCLGLSLKEWKDAGRERTSGGGRGLGCCGCGCFGRRGWTIPLSFPMSLLAGRSCCCSAAGGSQSSCCCRLVLRGFIPDKYRSFGGGCEWNAAGADMASVRHEYASVPDPGACVKSRRFPLLSGVVCRWGRLGHGRRFSRWRILLKLMLPCGTAPDCDRCK